MHIPSGDDEFLLKKISKQFKNGIAFMNSISAVVSTPPQKSLHDFVQQRLRWAGKWKYSSGNNSKLLAGVVFLFQLAILYSLFSLVIGHQVRTFAFLFFSKLVLEFVLLFNIGRFLNQEIKLLPFLLIQLLYPWYVLAIGLFSNFVSFNWKGRVLRARHKH
jgi:hypothetical protein